LPTFKASSKFPKPIAIMRATTRFLLLGAFAMCLSACLPEPPTPGDAAIFKQRPSRYGWRESGRPGAEGSGAKPQQEQQPQPPNNRFGHNDNKKPDSGSPSQNDSGNSNGPDSGSGPDSDAGSSSGNTAASSPDDDDKKKMTDSGNPSGGGNSSASAPPSNLNEYPYARLVPGKKGFVTLSGANAGVGEIDVTGIKPGTPVEITDPRNSSKKIYFRVP
jgi:hypothetical protein